MSFEECPFSVNDFMTKLSERVSQHNAKLLLQSALVECGLKAAQGPLKHEEAKALCLQLIKRGGPSFQVGKSIYQQILQ